MVYNPIGLPDHVLIVSQKLAIFCLLLTWGISVIARMDEFVHPPATTNDLELDDQIRPEKELSKRTMKPESKDYYLVRAFIINTCRKGSRSDFSN